jgi:type II secretory pathway pseudopilin PulG
MVGIVILGILMAVAAPSFLGQVKKAQDSAAELNLTVAYMGLGPRQ